MIRIAGQGRVARLMLTAGLAAAAVVTGTAGTAMAGTPAALPTGTVLDAGTDGAIANSYIVVLKPGSQAAAQVTSVSQQLVKRYGGKVLSNYIATVRGFHAQMTAAQAARLAADSSVQYVEQDAEVAMTGTETNAPWGLDRIDQRSLPLDGTYTSDSAAGVTAYIIDTGIRKTQKDFGGRASYGWDFINNTQTADDCNGHGTHVAGTIGGTKYGVAKDVNLVGVRVLDCKGSGPYSAIIAGIDWVTANAARPAVANMSVGGDKSAALNDAVTRSINAGITYAVAAGNENKNACSYSPSSTPAAITVGATDTDDSRAYFSNYGSCVDIFAPGVQITSDSNKSDTGTAVMSGTSMATPHVAGAAALVLARNPGWTPAQVRDTLVAQAGTGLIAAAGSGSPNKLLYTGFLNTAGRSASTSCGSFSDGSNLATVKQKVVHSSRRIVNCPGTATSAIVTVSVKTNYRGSVSLTLVDPAGHAHPLKTIKKSDHASNVTGSYRAALAKVSRSGLWTLRVGDSYGSTGYLDSWSLRV